MRSFGEIAACLMKRLANCELPDCEVEPLTREQEALVQRIMDRKERH